MGLIAIDNTNFENGLTNRNARDLFGSMRQPDPTRYHSYFEDFDYFTATDWTISGAGAGTQLLTDGDGGVLQLATAGGAADFELLQKVGENILVEAQPDRGIYCRSRFSLDEVLLSQVGIGLADEPPLPDPANGIYFRGNAGDALLDFTVRSDPSNVYEALGVTTLVADQIITAEWYWDGIDRVYYGIDGNPLGFLEVPVPPVGTLAPVFGIGAGQAAPLVGDFDYFFVAKQRG